MKKIINGKLYDTDTAKFISEKSYSNRRDFNYWCESLYKKRTGEYFLHGEGGPMSRYARTVGQNEWSGGEEIQPLSITKAREWAEENMDADDYMAEFGPVEEDESRITMSISIDAATADRIRKAAQEAGMSVSALIASKF